MCNVNYLNDKYLDKQLVRGIPLSEYFEIKKFRENYIKEAFEYAQNDDVIRYVLAGGGIANLDAAGNKILGMSRGVAYWVVAVVAVFEIIRAIVGHDKHKVMEILIGAAISYGSLFFVTFILDLIKETLG